MDSLIGDVKQSFLKAHQIIWNLDCWRYLLLPVVISVLLAFLLIGLCILLSTFFGGLAYEYLSGFFALPDWIKPLATVILIACGLGPCYIAFRSLVLVCYGPFLDRLSVEAEKLIVSAVTEPDRTIFESLKRPLLVAFFTISASLGVVICSLLLGGIPVIGLFLSGLVIFPLQIFLSSIAYIDPYFDRCGYGPRESFKIMRQNFCKVLVFGLVGLCITIIPLVGWFVGPTYSVVAGIVFAILLDKSKRQQDTPPA